MTSALRPRRTVFWLTLLALVPAAGLWAAEPAVDYVRDIKPLLTKRCLGCHSPVRQKSGYRIDTAAGAIRGGIRGAAVVPHHSDESPLLDAVTGAGGHPRMPPPHEGPPLNEDEVALLRRWIDAGAPAPMETPAPDPRDHWAFQPVRRPPVPSAGAGWARNPLDAFVAAQHAARGLAPSPEAPPHVLLRRVYLDLIGLRPTRAELHAFLSDPAPDAYERVVDRLLQRPEYGERWGRHWMDIWRYSDWAGWGQQVRDSQPHIWHWRDWIVEQLNADRPYDEMLVAMLAADEVSPGNLSELRATGFLARNYKRLSREQWLQDTVEHTAKSLLGLTLNCARCHDHMYDPIDQQEYYAFRAIFEPHDVRADRLPGVTDLNLDALPRVYDKELAVPTYFFIRGDERQPRTERPIPPGTPQVLGGTYQVRPIPLPRDAVDPFRQAFVVADDLAAARRAAEQARQTAAAPPARASAHERALGELQAELAAAQYAALQLITRVEQREAAGVTGGPEWWTLAEETVRAQRQVRLREAQRDELLATRQLAEHDAELVRLHAAASNPSDEARLKAQQAKRDEAQKKLAAATLQRQQAAQLAAQPLTAAYARRTVPTYPATSTGRRTALARWLVDPQHPLTPRVAVNHLWGRHFERALVETTSNFGVLGAAPSHPELLDWLAAEFVRPLDSAGTPWSMKHLHRLMVTSSTYRQAAFPGSIPEIRALASTATGLPLGGTPPSDPDNVYLWHFPSRRLEAEVIRDLVLATAGQLDRTLGGPDLDHERGLTVKRRSLYFRHAAEKQMTFLKLFDAAGVNECYQRRDSVMPQQALALANSELCLVQSRLLARPLSTDFADDAAFVAAAFETVISRSPSPAETAACLAFLAERQQAYARLPADVTTAGSPDDPGELPSRDPRLRARENLVHVLFNHHEFVTLP